MTDNHSISDDDFEEDAAEPTPRDIERDKARRRQIKERQAWEDARGRAFSKMRDSLRDLLQVGELPSAFSTLSKDFVMRRLANIVTGVLSNVVNTPDDFEAWKDDFIEQVNRVYIGPRSISLKDKAEKDRIDLESYKNDNPVAQDDDDWIDRDDEYVMEDGRRVVDLSASEAVVPKHIPNVPAVTNENEDEEDEDYEPEDDADEDDEYDSDFDDAEEDSDDEAAAAAIPRKKQRGGWFFPEYTY